MELSKVVEGFVDADTLVIKAQVQVIRQVRDTSFLFFGLFMIIVVLWLKSGVSLSSSLG